MLGEFLGKGNLGEQVVAVGQTLGVLQIVEVEVRLVELLFLFADRRLPVNESSEMIPVPGGLFGVDAQRESSSGLFFFDLQVGQIDGCGGDPGPVRAPELAVNQPIAVDEHLIFSQSTNAVAVVAGSKDQRRGGVAAKKPVLKEGAGLIRAATLFAEIMKGDFKEVLAHRIWTDEGSAVDFFAGLSSAADRRKGVELLIGLLRTAQGRRGGGKRFRCRCGRRRGSFIGNLLGMAARREKKGEEGQGAQVSKTHKPLVDQGEGKTRENWRGG